MDTTYATSLVFSVQVAVLAPIISFALALAVFGFYTLLFGIAFHLLYKNNGLSHRKLQIAWTTLLFLVTTLEALINASSGIDGLVVQCTALQTQDFLPFIKFATQDEKETVMMGLTYTCLIVANSIADSVLIYRMFLVWGSTVWVIAVPVIASVVINGLGLAGSIMQTKGFSNTAIKGNFQLETMGIHYLLSFNYANAVFNLILTLAIAGRIWWFGIWKIRSFDHGGTICKRYQQVIAVVIECGIIYPISLIVHTAVKGSCDKVAIPLDLTATVIQAAGIAPTLIVLRTCLGQSISQKVIDSQNTALAGCSKQFLPQRRWEDAKHFPNLVHAQTASQSEGAVHSTYNIHVADEV
ncbi:hypothetical protein GYMLUDRAFT_247971 [Collybiopsis luxurians FD-317 M1]|uniref:Uncharacterized protein n=1 Tax=Collybiopsis luxurians FD-317 M1 TaxID=944289 RepID=A0A0D0CDS4_9AGAR|nr:hypothetical protein GYMLUDRAFT_247971 [Collybiopsis luxurians FD-317 M1]